ncbi:LuxR family transcriptional regulator [Bradyrhizobium sp.]|jgi:LuxR family quorum sensing-dependent transcriptional regulator|uniref:helix-turn-helix transcriptional regulator n=1 Tax=Bradyrhizobium sp. TaxID=376 RepID=UPI002E0A2969|nr:LuxR family transcriptional regulator [Bradyrhizobium sp.]
MATHQGRYFQVALDAIEQFNRAEDLTGLSSQLARAIAPFGYQFFCCLSAPGVQKQVFGERILLNIWPEGWFERYQNSNFYAHDPVAASIRIRTEAFRWADVAIPLDDPLAQDVMTISSSEYHMRHGFCVPIHGLSGYQAGLSFAGYDVEDAKEANAALQLIGIYAFSRLASLKSAAKEHGILTEREREVVRWTAAGKTAWDTGGILNIAEDTVNKHIASAMRKLNVYSRAQAVAEAIRCGEIIP